MCLFCRPDFISPLDDLAFDMYQDPEIAGIIRKLEKKKQEAVLRNTFSLHIDNIGYNMSVPGILFP